MTQTIELTLGYCAIIDDADFELVSKFKWHVVCVRHHRYAHTNVRTDERRPNGKYKYKMMKLHRLIMNAKDGQLVDHKNSDGLDCRRSNMRLCTSRLNNFNKSAECNSSSEYKGVSWQESRCKWIAAIRVDGKSITIGRFIKEIDAAQAYNSAAKTFFGEFAWLNNLPQ